MISKTKSGYERLLIYVNKDAHNFEMRQPKDSFDFTCKFCPFCFVFIRGKFIFPKRS